MTETNELPEGVKQIPIEELSDKEQQEIAEFEEAQKVKGIGDMIDFTGLYSIKGRHNVWTATTGHVSKSKLVSISEYLNPSKKNALSLVII